MSSSSVSVPHWIRAFTGFPPLTVVYTILHEIINKYIIIQVQIELKLLNSAMYEQTVPSSSAFLGWAYLNL